MWAEELVGRTDEEVGAEPVQVEEAVLREMDPVDRDDGADRLGARHQVGSRWDRPDRIGRECERDELRPWRERLLERTDVDRDVVLVHVHPSHGRAGVGGRQHPRAHVRVVIQLRHDDLVAGLERPRERPGHVQEEGRRVGTEDDLARVRAGEVGGRAARLRDDDVRLLARGERPVRVAHPSPVVGRHRFDHRVGDLGATGGVREHRWPAVLADPSECGEPCADTPEVDHGHRLPHTVSGGNRRWGWIIRGRGPTHPATRGTAMRGRAAMPPIPGRRGALSR